MEKAGHAKLRKHPKNTIKSADMALKCWYMNVTSAVRNRDKKLDE